MLELEKLANWDVQDIFLQRSLWVSQRKDSFFVTYLECRRARQCKSTPLSPLKNTVCDCLGPAESVSGRMNRMYVIQKSQDSILQQYDLSILEYSNHISFPFLY